MRDWQSEFEVIEEYYNKKMEVREIWGYKDNYRDEWQYFWDAIHEGTGVDDDIQGYFDDIINGGCDFNQPEIEGFSKKQKKKILKKMLKNAEDYVYGIDISEEGA